jgi:hypothetical protein
VGPRPQAVHEVVQGVDRDPELERGGKGLSLAIAAASCSRRAMHMSSGTSDGVCSGPSSHRDIAGTVFSEHEGRVRRRTDVALDAARGGALVATELLRRVVGPGRAGALAAGAHGALRRPVRSSRALKRGGRAP